MPTDLVHGLLYGPVHGPLFTDPHKKTIIKWQLEIWLTVCLFCSLILLPPSLWRWKEDKRTSKKTNNWANLCIRCWPPIASAILFGSFLLVFSDSSQTSKLRHGIFPCFHVFHGANTQIFLSQQKKNNKKNSTPGGFTYFSFFLNYSTQIIVIKCEGTQGRF